jgi:PBP1b-binding outer membrane lipoprotein LpoB
MKILYIALLLGTLLSAACQSPAKKQHQNKLQKANTLQNNSAEATTDPENSIGSGNLTDSTHTDTGGRK